MGTSAIHLVRVTPDDLSHRLWVAATPRAEAVDHVLDAVPEGWAARLMDESFGGLEDGALHLAPGEVREIRLN